MTAAILLLTGALLMLGIGALVGHLATRWGMQRDREVIAARKDTAIEAALDTAQELQRISGELPQVDLLVPPGNATFLGNRPVHMTGARDLAAQDQELVEIYGIGRPYDWTVEDDTHTTLPRALPGRYGDAGGQRLS